MKSMNTVVLAGFLATALSGCAPSTVLELKSEAVTQTFSVEEPYQRVFKDVRAELNRCMFGGFIAAETTIDGQLYPDLGEGEISVRYNNMGDKSVFLHVEIEGDTNTAEVTTYATSWGVWDKAGERVKRFAVDKESMC